MAQFTRIEVAQKMKETGLVPLFYNQDAALCKNIIKACYDGGARLFEFTARGDFAHEVFKELMKFSIKEMPQMILGVGSVTDAAAASLYLQMGANFIVTPVFREDIATICNRRKVLWSPGCGSLTEIARAEELGCEVVKLFPGDVYGPQFIKGVLAPQPWTSIMPTGGVSLTEKSLKEWFDAGAFCVGIGSKLISEKWVKSKNFPALANAVKEALDIIHSVRTLEITDGDTM